MTDLAPKDNMISTIEYQEKTVTVMDTKTVPLRFLMITIQNMLPEPSMTAETTMTVTAPL